MGCSVQIDLFEKRGNTLRNNLRIEEMKSPYYFYLHSKFSDLCFKFDRNYGHLIPNFLATQWLIVATKPEKPLETSSPIKMHGEQHSGVVQAMGPKHRSLSV